MVSKYLTTECKHCNKTIPKSDIDGHEFNANDRVVIYRTGMNYGRRETFCSIRCLLKDKMIKRWKIISIKTIKRVLGREQKKK